MNKLLKIILKTYINAPWSFGDPNGPFYCLLVLILQFGFVMDKTDSENKVGVKVGLPHGLSRIPRHVLIL